MALGRRGERATERRRGETMNNEKNDKNHDARKAQSLLRSINPAILSPAKNYKQFHQLTPIFSAQVIKCSVNLFFHGIGVHSQ